jgi:hypothetical protein
MPTARGTATNGLRSRSISVAPGRLATSGRDPDQVALLLHAEPAVELVELRRDRDRVLHAVPRVGERERASAARAHDLGERAEAADRRAVDGQEQVARAQPALLGGAVRRDARHEHGRRPHAERIDAAERGHRHGAVRDGLLGRPLAWIRDRAAALTAAQRELDGLGRRRGRIRRCELVPALHGLAVHRLDDLSRAQTRRLRGRIRRRDPEHRRGAQCSMPAQPTSTGLPNSSLTVRREIGSVAVARAPSRSYAIAVRLARTRAHGVLEVAPPLDRLSRDLGDPIAGCSHLAPPAIPARRDRPRRCRCGMPTASVAAITITGRIRLATGPAKTIASFCQVFFSGSDSPGCATTSGSSFSSGFSPSIFTKPPSGNHAIT